MRTVAFLGSKQIGAFCLNHLIQNQEDLDISIAYVLTNNRTLNNQEQSVADIASKYNIPVFESAETLESNPVDFLISVQYHEILSAKQIEQAKLLAINLHMAPLPEYRGCNQFSFAILDNAKEFGTTIHKLETGIDSGALIAEKRFDIPFNCTVSNLYELTFEASKTLFVASIKDILFGKFTPIEQKHLIAERGTSLHFRNEMNRIKQIDLNWPDDQIDLHIRATYFPPFPPPFAIRNKEKIELTPNWRQEI